MYGDLFGPALGSDVLGARQRRAPAVARKADQVLGDDPHGSPRAFLPRRIGRRVDDNLTHHSPAGVVRVTAGHQKSRQRLGDPRRPRLGAMAVEMPERGAHSTAVLDCPRELTGGSARLFSVIVDSLTVLGPWHADESLELSPGAADRERVREASPANERGNVPTSYPVELIYLITETYPPLSETAPAVVVTQPAV